MTVFNVDLFRPSWHTRAACRGLTAMMFDRGRTVEARRVCADCPVAAECADAGLWEQHGVWGGRTLSARAVLRRGLPMPPARRALRVDPIERRKPHTPDTRLCAAAGCTRGTKSPAHRLCGQCMRPRAVS